MIDKELKILFLKTKFDSASKNLTSEEFYKLVSHKIGWSQYNQILSEYVNNSLLDYETHCKLTKLGENTLRKLVSEQEKEANDKIAERKKLHNESVISGWKRKTFWYIFVLGLFGGIYSAVDLFHKITDEPEFQKKVYSKEEIQRELNKLRTLIIDLETRDSINAVN